MSTYHPGDRVQVGDNSVCTDVPVGSQGVIDEAAYPYYRVRLDSNPSIVRHFLKDELTVIAGCPVATHYQPVLAAPDVGPESVGPTPDEIRNITRSFCR